MLTYYPTLILNVLAIMLEKHYCWNLKGRWQNFFSFLIKITSQACFLGSGLELIFHWKAHCFILEISLLSSKVVIIKSWITGKREASLAKSSVLDDKPSAKLLRYIKNNNGAIMESWGTPALTLGHEEYYYPFNTTLCFLFVKNCFKAFNKLPDILFLCNLNIRPFCQTLSNALDIYLINIIFSFWDCW